MYPRLISVPQESFFLFGVRGVGKSTWANRTFAHAHRIDLLDEGLYQALLADPSAFAAEVEALEPGSTIVVDEVQRLPVLLNDVHRLIEARGDRFVLLGSSARKLKTAGTNLLAGRAVWKRMYPLMPAELEDDFALDRALEIGTIPLVWTSPDPRSTLEAYVQLYLKEEIRAEALVRNLPAFARFLPIAALFHGQVINVSGLARDAGAARTTIAGYLDILEDTLLIQRLPAFEAKLRVRERKHPKLYWVDPGIVRALKKQLGPVGAEERGALFEGWIHSLLCCYRDERSVCDDIFYWSPAQARDVEVDFLLKRGNEFVAIEAKADSRPRTTIPAGLHAIADLPGVVRRIVVYRGTRRLRVDDIDVWPVETLVRALMDGTLFP